MTERELLEKIKASANEIEFPEKIHPEEMKRKLDGLAAAGGNQADNRHGKSEKGIKAKRRKGIPDRRIAAAAAVAVLLVGLGGTAVLSDTGDAVQVAQKEGEEQGEPQSALSEEQAVGTAEPKKDAGTLYMVAEDYGEVYDCLYEYALAARRNLTDTLIMGVDDAAADDSVDMAATSGAAQQLQAKRNESEESYGSSEEQSGEESYSRTNVQTAGVDESDIVKTDGSYIYVICEDVVEIVDVRGGAMELTGKIAISMDSATDQVLEMYVDGDVLNLIVEREKTDLEEQSAAEYYIETNVETELLTYDITNRKAPVLAGSITQDGYYKTSRKIDNIVYLFTQEWMELPGLTREEAVIGEYAGGWIPIVNGAAVAADCIYVPEAGEVALIISSTDISNPDEVVDDTMILNNYVSVYVSSDALYLYGTAYLDGSVRTQIAKFSLEDGIIQAVGATQAAGQVTDTFAINEYKGSLRLLTTDTSSDTEENLLYLFDENLELTGELSGIAAGERIYAARYLGDIAYFVTYRNTDPLFAVDLSDVTDPKILSELEITGFSEYLHFWGEDKLVGIGYETDANSGVQEGIKLTMFDISDPAKLKTIATCVLDGLDYSPALYDYKCVLADAGENLLGFAGVSYDSAGGNISYFLFAWAEGSFKNLLTESLVDDEEEEAVSGKVVVDFLYAEENIWNYRGIYIGEKFYVVNSREIVSYDREKDYRVIQKLRL